MVIRGRDKHSTRLVFSGNIAIFCSDERFVDDTLKFLKSKLGKFDVIGVPGGARFVVDNEKQLMDKLWFLIEKHDIRKAVLIAHKDCGYYKSLYPTKSADEIENIQVADLKTVAEILSVKGVEVSVFYTRFSANGDVVVKAVKQN